MTGAPPPLSLSRCASCRNLYLPTPGPCPRCGARDAAPEGCPGLGVVLAATELSNPPEGFAAPHRLALVELMESARLLAIVDGPLPVMGDTLELFWQHDQLHARATP